MREIFNLKIYDLSINFMSNYLNKTLLRQPHFGQNIGIITRNPIIISRFHIIIIGFEIFTF